MSRGEITLAGGSIDGDLLCVLNRARDGVQSAADRALEMTDSAVAIVRSANVFFEVRPGLSG